MLEEQFHRLGKDIMKQGRQVAANTEKTTSLQHLARRQQSAHCYGA